MVKQITLTHSEEFSCEYLIDDVWVSRSSKAKEHTFDLHPAPCNIKIMLDPYKIKPTVRIDGIMVNYGLAQITPWDHMLELDIPQDFFDRYFEKIVESKRLYLGIDKSEIHKKIGLEDLSDLVDKIEGRIS